MLTLCLALSLGLSPVEVKSTHPLAITANDPPPLKKCNCGGEGKCSCGANCTCKKPEVKKDEIKTDTYTMTKTATGWRVVITADGQIHDFPTKGWSEDTVKAFANTLQAKPMASGGFMPQSQPSCKMVLVNGKWVKVCSGN